MIGRQNKTVIKKQDDKQVLLRISDLDTESLNSFWSQRQVLQLQLRCLVKFGNFKIWKSLYFFFGGIRLGKKNPGIGKLSR